MPTDDATAPLPGTAYAVLAAQDEMMLWGRTEATEAALNEALAAYYAAAALDPDSLQAVLARTVGEALAEADGVPALIEQTRADVAAAFDIPQPLADAWRQIDEEA